MAFFLAIRMHHPWNCDCTNIRVIPLGYVQAESCEEAARKLGREITAKSDGDCNLNVHPEEAICGVCSIVLKRIDELREFPPVPVPIETIEA